jgi:hypothetical protein
LNRNITVHINFPQELQNANYISPDDFIREISHALIDGKSTSSEKILSQQTMNNIIREKKEVGSYTDTIQCPKKRATAKYSIKEKYFWLRREDSSGDFTPFLCNGVNFLRKAETLYYAALPKKTCEAIINNWKSQGNQGIPDFLQAPVSTLENTYIDFFNGHVRRNAQGRVIGHSGRDETYAKLMAGISGDFPKTLCQKLIMNCATCQTKAMGQSKAGKDAEHKKQQKRLEKKRSRDGSQNDYDNVAQQSKRAKGPNTLRNKDSSTQPQIQIALPNMVSPEEPVLMTEDQWADYYQHQHQHGLSPSAQMPEDNNFSSSSSSSSGSLQALDIQTPPNQEEWRLASNFDNLDDFQPHDIQTQNQHGGWTTSIASYNFPGYEQSDMTSMGIEIYANNQAPALTYSTEPQVATSSQGFNNAVDGLLNQFVQYNQSPHQTNNFHYQSDSTNFRYVTYPNILPVEIVENRNPVSLDISHGNSSHQNTEDINSFQDTFAIDQIHRLNDYPTPVSDEETSPRTNTIELLDLNINSHSERNQNDPTANHDLVNLSEDLEDDIAITQADFAVLFGGDKY